MKIIQREQEQQIKELTKLNMELQRDVININRALVEKIEKMVTGKSTNKDNVEIGAVVDDEVHLGQNVFIKKCSYDSANVTSRSGTQFVKNIAMAVFGALTLKNSSVTGKTSNNIKKEICRPALCPTKLSAVHDIYAFYLKNKGYSKLETERELKHVNYYLASKISDLNRLPREPRSESDEEGEDYVIDLPSDFVPNERGSGYQFFSCMKKYKNSVAQYDSDTGEEQTYEELLRRCIRTALHLRERNLSKENVVMLCSNNHQNSCVPFIASLFLGIPTASLDPGLSIMDTSHLLKQVTPNILFIVSDALELIEMSLLEAGVETEIVIFGESDKYTEFSEFLQPHEDEEKFFPEPVSSLQVTVAILFSSGTTGLPKGIMIHHYALMGQADNIIKSGNVGSVTLSYASLYWISSLLLLSAIVFTGGARVLCSHFDPVELWSLIDKYKISLLFLSPSQAVDMVKAGRPDNLDTTSLWACFTGGAPLSEKYLWKLRDLLPGTFLFQVYGQSEVAGILTLFKTNEVKDTLCLHHKPRSVGLAISGFRYKVINTDTGKLCGPNESGELRVKSKFVMNGYFKKDSSESFDSHGWLRTGDIVYYDEDRCFYVVDRIKELLKYKSWHVAPAMLEQVLVNHPSVKEALVIGIPHDEDGDLPMALITLNEESKETTTTNDIESYVTERVPDRMKLRGGVKFLESLLVTPSGKVKRAEMRNMVLNGEL